MVTASSLVALLSAREYKYGGGFDAGDGDGKGFGGDGTMLMASTSNCCASGEGIILGWRLL